MAAAGEFDLGEKQRFMALAAGRMDGGGQETSAVSDETQRPQAASNPGVVMPEAGLLTPSRPRAASFGGKSRAS